MLQSGVRVLAGVGQCARLSRKVVPANTTSHSLLPRIINSVGGVRKPSRVLGERQQVMMGVSRQSHHHHNHHSPAASSITVDTAQPLPSTSMIQVTWGGGGTDVFPYVWLRDNCLCPSCFLPTAFARQVLLEEVKVSVRPTSVSVVEEGGVMEVKWCDGHHSSYPATWLHQRAFNTVQQNLHHQTYRLERTLWGSELLEDLPCASFPALLGDDEALLRFLQQIEVYGLVLVKDVPKKEEQLFVLSHRVGPLQHNHYGQVISIRSKHEPSNLAFTESAIDLHSDMIFMDTKPDVQLLHCIRQVGGTGGANMLADSLHAALRFREVHPRMFDVLSRMDVEFWDKGIDKGNEFHVINRLPIISTDRHGNIVTINVHHMSRHSFFGVSAQEVTDWYEAMYTFYGFLKDPRNCLQYKLEEGEMLVIDNWRLLHSRTKYDRREGERLLEVGYFSWTDVRSRRRVLQEKLGC